MKTQNKNHSTLHCGRRKYTRQNAMIALAHTLRFCAHTETRGVLVCFEWQHYIMYIAAAAQQRCGASRTRQQSLSRECMVHMLRAHRQLCATAIPWDIQRLTHSIYNVWGGTIAAHTHTHRVHTPHRAECNQTQFALQLFYPRTHKIMSDLSKRQRNMPALDTYRYYARAHYITYLFIFLTEAFYSACVYIYAPVRSIARAAQCPQ